MPKVLLVILFFWCFSHTAYGQTDTVMRTGISLNAGELANWVRDEPNVRLAFEQRFLHNYALLLEPGWYMVGSGYNFRAEIKCYRPLFTEYWTTPLSYFGVAFLVKDHFYREPLEYYTDSSRTVVTSYRLPVHKHATVFSFVAGWVHTYRHFYWDGYVGLGVRFKFINGFTPAQDYLIEDNVAGSGELIPGHHVLPDISGGIRLGLKLNKPRNITPEQLQ